MEYSYLSSMYESSKAPARECYFNRGKNGDFVSHFILYHDIFLPLIVFIQSRGSDNPNTGPIRDHSSFANDAVTGAFAYIDASSPRRTNDVAQIISESFPATNANQPMCLRYENAKHFDVRSNNTSTEKRRKSKQIIW